MFTLTCLVYWGLLSRHRRAVILPGEKLRQSASVYPYCDHPGGCSKPSICALGCFGEHNPHPRWDPKGTHRTYRKVGELA